MILGGMELRIRLRLDECVALFAIPSVFWSLKRSRALFLGCCSEHAWALVQEWVSSMALLFVVDAGDFLGVSDDNNHLLEITEVDFMVPA